MLFDSNVLINHLKGVPEAVAWVQKVQNREITGYISPIVEIELFSGKETGDPRKLEFVKELLSLFIRMELTREISLIAGQIRRVYGVKLADAAIAATAMALRCDLLTNNMSDFKNIQGLKMRVAYRST